MCLCYKRNRYNRLLAISQDGYVSHYWYDADGERTVKMHGGNQAVFVNSRQDGRVLDTLQTTAYFSPYFSIHEGRFTKHLYIGSERIASITGELKPGDVSNSQAGGYNISHAGYGVDVTLLNIPYACKCAAMIDSAEANYAFFDLPNALDGQPRQLREFVLPAGGGNEAEAPALRSGDKNNYNGDIWFIHTDHLGSSLLVTDGNGEVSQQVEYLPYGEVFLERQNGDYATPYKFNGKELDEETGLYYYGARYMNPRLSIWYGCDPLQEKYPGITTYSYCHGNPVNTMDPFGLDTIHMNLNAEIDYVNHEGNDINVVIFGKSERLSGIDISKSLYNRKVVTNIINYYASQLGLYGVKISSEQGNGSVPAFHRDGVIYINQCSNGSISNILNNKYNLWNVLVHEGLHKLNGRESGYLGHAKIYLDMFAHDTFQKTTTEFKSSVIKSFVGLVLMAYNNGNQQQKNEAVWLISRFNAEKYGVSLSFDKTLQKITANGAVFFNRFIFNFTGDGYNINFRKSKTY